MDDLEDALKKLDRLTQEEARMALAEMLSVTHNIRDDVKIVDGKVERVENKVEDVGDKVGDKVEEVGDKVGDVGDKVQRVDDKVQVIIDGARTCPIRCQTILTSILADGKQTRVAAQETRLVVQHAANDIDEIKCSWLPNIAIICSSLLNLLAGNHVSSRVSGNSFRYWRRFGGKQCCSASNWQNTHRNLYDNVRSCY